MEEESYVNHSADAAAKIQAYDVLVAAGTTEAREVLAAVRMQGLTAAAVVATQLGAEVLAELREQGIGVFVGRRDTEAFADLLRRHRIRLVIDATHPFAVSVTETLKAACAGTGTDYVRYQRQAACYDYQGIIEAEDAGAAAEMLSAMPGRFLLTTGANTVHIYTERITDFNRRGYVRVLDTESSVQKCLDAGIMPSRVIAANPPFSEADNTAVIRALDIRVLVSKDSGRNGGLPEKIASARAAGIPLILIRRPPEDGGISSKAELIKILEREGNKRCVEAE